MTDENSRVLGRRGARIVTASEANTVHGGIQHETETLCSIGATATDGDLFTGDCIAN